MKRIFVVAGIARANEPAKVIEEKLGVNSEGSGKKETVKVESKKTIKK
jgi:hypothetical protein